MGTWTVKLDRVKEDNAYEDDCDDGENEQQVGLKFAFKSALFGLVRQPLHVSCLCQVALLLL